MNVSQLFQMAGRNARPVAFWFLNHHLDDDELIRQIREMAGHGFGGVMLHPRDGLRTPYLSEHWSHAVGICIEEAKKHGLSVWLYDDNHYPSGPAGGLLPVRYPDRTMKSMALIAERRIAAEEDLNLPDPGNSFRTAVGWGQSPAQEEVRIPLNRRRLRLATSLKSGETAEWGEGERPFPGEPVYACILAEISFAEVPTAVGHYAYPFYPDGYDEELTDEFIQRTHRWYADRFGEEFGKTVKGIFTDNYSPNFGFLRRSAPWGCRFAEKFRAATGEPVETFLPAVFCAEIPDADRKRIVFWRFVGREYLHDYYDRITDFCRRRNLLTTGHLCLEDGMAEHARQIGDYFEVMRAFTLTAVDQLGPGTYGGSLVSRPENGEELIGCIRNTASAALWNGSARVMCECCGGASVWRLDLAEIRRITGWLFGLGVDLFVPHGLYYSIAGSRKWECTPDHLHNPQWRHYQAWTDWIGKLCELGAGGIPLARILVLYPIHALRAGLEVHRPSEADRLDAGCYGHGVRANRVQRCFRKVLEALCGSHYDFAIMDETTLRRVSADGSIELPERHGRMQFDVLILPEMDIVEVETVSFLSRFSGRVIPVDAPPRQAFDGVRLIPCDTGRRPVPCDRLTAELNLPRAFPLDNAPELITRSWRKDGVVFHYLFNSGRETVQLPPGQLPPGLLVDERAGTLRAASPDGERIPTAGMLLVADGIETPESSVPVRRAWRRTEELTLPDWRIQAPEPNLLPLSEWTVHFSGPVSECRLTFEAACRPEKIALLLDMESADDELYSGRFGRHHVALLNGQKVPALTNGKILDFHIYETDIAGLVRPGQNELVVRQSSFLLDRERPLHPVILAGDFAVGDGNRLEPFPPLDFGPWLKQGLPCYQGEVVYRTRAEIPENGHTELFMEPCGGSCECRIDGRHAAWLIAPSLTADLSRWRGRTVDLELRVAGVPRNLWERNKEPVPTGIPVAPKLIHRFD